jgi:photosystem II stability/assembly factor-like uncharacterized protein
MQLCRLSLLLFAATIAAAVQSTVAATSQLQSAAQQVWQMQESGTTASLRGIDSVDGQVAWASGSEGTVLKTIDGGAHWTKCAVPDAATDGAKLDFRGVQAWDSATAIVMSSGPGDKSRLYKTVDGCATWALLFKNPDSPDGFFDSFWLNGFYGEGILLGDPVKGRFTVFETEDGGQTWKRDERKGLALRGDSLAAFAASNSSIARSGDQYIPGFVTGGKTGAVLYERWVPPHFEKLSIHLKHGDKAGPDWTTMTLPLAGGSDAAGAFSIGYRTVEDSTAEALLKGGEGGHRKNWRFVAVGGDYTKPAGTAGTAAWSEDDGKHWAAADTPPHGYRSSVEWSDAVKGWIAAGTSGSDISRDEGRTWSPLDNGDWNALSLPFVVGPKGRIARLNASGLASLD